MLAVGLTNQPDSPERTQRGDYVKGLADLPRRTGQLWQCDITCEDGKFVVQGRVRLQNVPMPSSAHRRNSFCSGRLTHRGKDGLPQEPPGVRLAPNCSAS